MVLQTKVEPVNHSNPRVFPRITMCNLRPFASGMDLNQGPNDGQSLPDLMAEFQEALGKVTNCNGQCTEDEEFLLEILNTINNTSLGMVQYHGAELMQEFGHTLEGFVISCSKTYTNGITSFVRPCYDTINFTRVFHPEMMNCYSTYIPMGYDYVGMADGLSFILFLDSLILGDGPDLYHGFDPHSNTHTAGVFLELSDKASMPLMGTKKTLLNSGNALWCRPIFNFNFHPRPIAEETILTKQKS